MTPEEQPHLVGPEPVAGEPSPVEGFLALTARSLKQSGDTNTLSLRWARRSVKPGFRPSDTTAHAFLPRQLEPTGEQDVSKDEATMIEYVDLPRPRAPRRFGQIVRRTERLTWHPT